MIKTTKIQHYIIPCVIALSSISTTVYAAPNLGSLADHWYIGGSLGQSNLDPDGGNTWRTTGDTDLAKKVYIGTDISRQFGLEAFWADFGSAELTSKTNKTGKVNYKAVGANVVYNSPYKIAGIRPLGKLGVAKFNNTPIIVAGGGGSTRSGSSRNYDILNHIFFKSWLAAVSMGSHVGLKGGA